MIHHIHNMEFSISKKFIGPKLFIDLTKDHIPPLHYISSDESSCESQHSCYTDHSDFWELNLESWDNLDKHLNKKH
jgi:hypothetical protein